MNFFHQFQIRIFNQVDATSLVVFRIGFGIIMLVEMWRYWSNDWITKAYITPSFMFKYYGFEWVQVWPENGMYIHFAVLTFSALGITLGVFYRISIITFTVAFAYIFLLDQSLYLNHFYLVILVSIIMCVIPAHRTFSIDAWLRPKIKSQTVPVWAIWILRAQMEILLIYAGLVKINYDWLHLQPLSMWLAKRADFPFFGYFFTQEWSVAIAAYGVIILHIVGAPLLLWKRTRLTVFVIYAGFHTLNHFVFRIGIFPWFTLLGTLMFFDPNWPRKLGEKLKSVFSNSIEHSSLTKAPDSAVYHIHPIHRHLVIFFILIWTSTQVLIPLRHFLYPGNVSWTEEGHRFSWQMKLRSKRSAIEFNIVNPTNREEFWHIDPSEFLTKKQIRTMAGKPDMILQFAHFLAEHWEHKYQRANMEVLATAFVSLNGRPRTLLIDPGKNLAGVERNLWPADWILPLDEPLPELANND